MVSGIDYVVIALYFGSLLLVGYISLKRARSGEDYLLAGRTLPMPMFAAAMAAVVIGGGGTLGAIITLIYLFMIAVLQIVGIGTILSTMLGWSPQAAMIVGGCIILVYLIMGGMWAVAMTDVIQIVVMTVGVMILVPVFALREVGGISGLQANLPPAHFQLMDIGLPRIIAYIFTLLPGFLVGQDVWQKAFTAKDKKTSSYGTLIASIYIALYGAGVILLGMCLRAAMPAMEDTTMVFATAAVTFMPVGFRGLLLAAALAASFVTVTAFFIIDGITAVTPIIYGMAVSAATFFITNALDKRKREITFQEERIFVDGVEQTIEK